MKILILGQPRSGKSTVAKKLNDKLNIPIICTDKYRREWGFHEPWKGYETEINPIRQFEFYEKLKNEINNYKDIIVEGSAINPKDRDYFNFDVCILLGRKYLSVTDEFILSRKYDNDWTSKRNDDYLIKLFKEYKNFSNIWRMENINIYYDTSNYNNIENIVNEILQNILK